MSHLSYLFEISCSLNHKVTRDVLKSLRPEESALALFSFDRSMVHSLQDFLFIEPWLYPGIALVLRVSGQNDSILGVIVED